MTVMLQKMKYYVSGMETLSRYYSSRRKMGSSAHHKINHRHLLPYVLSLGMLLNAPCSGAVENSEDLEISVRPAQMQYASVNKYSNYGIQPLATTSITGITEEPFAEDYADDPADTNVNITMRRRTERVDLKTHFDANYRFTPAQMESIDQKVRVNEFYMDAFVNENTISTRVGRQPYNIAGANGRFDGITLGYRLFNRQKMNLVAGYTQDLANPDNLENDSYMYGVNIDSGRFANRWQADLYALERSDPLGPGQQVMGSRLRYLHPAHPILFTVDFNPVNDELSNANLRLDFKLPSRNSVRFAIDYCKPGPGLSTRDSTLNALLNALPIEESQSLEQDPSAMLRSTGIRWSTRFSNSISLNSETSFASLDRLTTSGEAYSFNQRSFGVEFVRSDKSRPDTSSRLSFRYLENDLDNHMMLSFHNRFMPYRSWLADLMLEADWQKQKDQSTAMSLYPTLRVQYHDRDKRTLEVEVGMKQVEVVSLSDSLRDNDFYLRITHSFPLYE